MSDADQAGAVRAGRRSVVRRPRRRRPARAQDHRRAGAKPDRHFGERLVRRGGTPHRHHRAIAAPLGQDARSAFCGARSIGEPRKATRPRRRPPSWRAASKWPRARSNTAWTRSPPSAATSRRGSSSATFRTPTCTCSRPPSTNCWRNFPDASVEVLDGHYDDLLNALRSGSIDIWSMACCGGRHGPSTSKRNFCSPTAMRWWRGAIIRSGRCAGSRSRISRVTTGSCRNRARRGVTPSSRSSKGINRNPKSASKPRRAGSTGRCSARATGCRWSRIAKWKPTRPPVTKRCLTDRRGFQRDDGIAIRKDWRPTRIHLEFLDRLTALAGQSRGRSGLKSGA